VIGKVKARGVGDTMLREGAWGASVDTSSAGGKVSWFGCYSAGKTYFGIGYREFVKRA
jgi:hypothetical protein